MILIGDAFEKLATLENESVQACVTSPPYWGLRDYGHAGQLGQEPTPEAYVNSMRLIFEQVRRVLKRDGTLWLNLGDSYARNGGTQEGGNRELLHMAGKQKRMLKVPAGTGLKPKDLCGIPWAVAFALRADGWYLRQDIIWHKPNVMPESVKDRCTKSHEYVFLLAKSEKYLFDINAIREPAKFPKGPGNKSAYEITGARIGNNANVWSGNHKIGPRDTRQKRSVWTVTTKPFKGAHFATFPADLIEPCILAGTRPGDTVLDPFFGAGTTGLVAKKHGRNYIGIEINPEYAAMADARINPLEARECVCSARARTYE